MATGQLYRFIFSNFYSILQLLYGLHQWEDGIGLVPIRRSLILMKLWLIRLPSPTTSVSGQRDYHKPSEARKLRQSLRTRNLCQRRLYFKLSFKHLTTNSDRFRISFLQPGDCSIFALLPQPLWVSKKKKKKQQQVANNVHTKYAYI